MVISATRAGDRPAGWPGMKAVGTQWLGELRTVFEI
jgi:hypothetical protein